MTKTKSQITVVDELRESLSQRESEHSAKVLELQTRLAAIAEKIGRFNDALAKLQEQTGIDFDHDGDVDIDDWLAQSVQVKAKIDQLGKLIDPLVAEKQVLEVELEQIQESFAKQTEVLKLKIAYEEIRSSLPEFAAKLDKASEAYFNAVSEATQQVVELRRIDNRIHLAEGNNAGSYNDRIATITSVQLYRLALNLPSWKAGIFFDSKPL